MTWYVFFSWTYVYLKYFSVISLSTDSTASLDWAICPKRRKMLSLPKMALVPQLVTWQVVIDKNVSPYDPQTHLHQSQLVMWRVMTQSCAIFCGTLAQLLKESRHIKVFQIWPITCTVFYIVYVHIYWKFINQCSDWKVRVEYKHCLLLCQKNCPFRLWSL